MMRSIFILLLCAGAVCAQEDPTPRIDAQAAGMTVGQAVVLGVVEGTTEYLPVSSTGHLILTQRAMGIGTEGGDAKTAADAFAICIQAGAILAVLGLYWRHVRKMLLGLLGRDASGLRLLMNLIVAFLPAAVVGLTIDKWIKQYLFGLWPVTAAWFIGGVGILGVSIWLRRRRLAGEGAETHGISIESLTVRMALVIGVCQCAAMWPGTSRALATILGGLLVGMSLPAAVEFSFLLGVMTLGAATGYDTLKHGPLMLELYCAAPLVVGSLAAFVSAAIAIKGMVAYLNKYSLALFGWYRIVLAILVGMLLLAGRIAP